MWLSSDQSMEHMPLFLFHRQTNDDYVKWLLPCHVVSLKENGLRIRLFFIFHLTQDGGKLAPCKCMEGESLLSGNEDMTAPAWRWRQIGVSWVYVPHARDMAGSLYSTNKIRLYVFSALQRGGEIMRLERAWDFFFFFTETDLRFKSCSNIYFM